MSNADDSRLCETAPLEGMAADGNVSAPGGTIDRFVVIGALGRGGMGVVLAAYDPALDRKVALKLLRPDVWRGPGATEGRDRLQREAQAMAKLSHPNVVTVHEVGAVDEQLFIAMEFVDGQTLKAWLAVGPRHWREIVSMFLAAGRGLQAAHAAGLVHRDFKPENVLVGSDGRPRVGDFGLVSLPRGRAGADAAEPGATRRGAILGTPGYMSPEQLLGQPSDAQSDQFSFCIALYEALFGEMPFPVEDGAHRDAVLHGRVRPPPKKSGVPAWITDVVLRGLRADRAARWPSMAALIDALAHDPAERRRRRTLIGGAALLALGVVVGAGAWIRHTRPPLCSGAAARLRGVWDATRRAQVERAFAATGMPYAHDTFAKVAALLDRYTDAWVAMHGEACRATLVEGRQSDSLLDLRMACLERHRSTLGAITNVWADGVASEALENAIAAASSLPPVDECADARALADRVPAPKDPAARARIEATRTELDRVRALREAKRLQEARVAAEAARRHADATAFSPVQAEAAFVLGSLLHSFGEPAAAQSLEDAAKLAAAARDDRLAAAALIELIGALADARQAPSAILLAPLAEAFVVRAGNRPEQRGALLFARGTALEDAGKYPEARACLVEARALLADSVGAKDPLTLGVITKLARVADASGDYATNKALGQELLETGTEILGPDHPQTGTLLRTLGLFALHAGDRATARQLFERALANAERAFGGDSLQTAMVVNNLGVLAEDEGNLDEAERDYERVLTIRRRFLGSEHPLVAHALANLSGIRGLEGHLDEALAQVREALAIMTKTYGPAHPDVAFDLGLYADVLAERGDLAGAREKYQRALDTWNQIKGPEHLDTLGLVVRFAQFHGRHGKCAEARKLALPAIATLQKVGGPNHPDLAEALALVARCDLREGAPAAAVPRLQRALAIEELPGMSLADRGAVRLDLARALRASGSDGRRADELAAQAERELRHAGVLGARELSTRGY